MRYANGSQRTAVGYAFFGPQTAAIGLDEVTRSRRTVRVSNPDTNVTKRVFSVSLDRAAAAYALVPGASEQKLRSYADGPVSVLVNDIRVQAVKHCGLSIVAANTFTAGTHHAERFVIDGPASVLVQESPGGGTTIAVSDPTMVRGTITVIIRGRAMRAVSTDDGVRVSQVAGGTRIDVTTHHTYGHSLTAHLR